MKKQEKKPIHNTTLCYIEQNGCYLMLYRNKKKNDVNQGKWIGVGGKVEEGESYEECMLREVREETGLTLQRYQYRGMIKFISDLYESETMALYTADQFSGHLIEDCNEGELKWIPHDQIMELSLWEGDRIFLKELLEGKENINLTFTYQGDKLISVSKEEYSHA